MLAWREPGFCGPAPQLHRCLMPDKVRHTILGQIMTLLNWRHQPVAVHESAAAIYMSLACLSSNTQGTVSSLTDA